LGSCDESSDRLQDMIKVYLHTKALVIEAEEFDGGFKTFLHPKLELVHALDHLMRLLARQNGLLAPTNSDGAPSDAEDDAGYSKSNVDKALGHVYRAFFDTADWLALRIREKIQLTMGAYSHECICSVAPEYYQGIRPELEKIRKGISEIRMSKDVSNRDILVEVETYNTLIEKLVEYVSAIELKVPSLQEAQGKLEQTKKRSWLKDICLVVIGAVLAFLANLVWG
jgi:hypothetical protein